MLDGRLSKHKKIFYGSLLILLALGLFLIYWPEAIAHQILFLKESFLEELGKAFLVAFILALTVDTYLKQRLASDFLRDVSPFVEGIGLPEEFQHEIAFIRRIPVFRKNLQLTYRISRLTGTNKGYIRLHTSLSYEVVNHTDDTQKYTAIASCEDAYPGVGRSRILSAGASGPEGPLFPPYASKAEKPELEFERDIQIPAKSGPTVFWVDMESYEEENGGDVFYLTEPTINVTVRVERPPDFRIKVYFGHRFGRDPGKEAGDTPSQIKAFPAEPDTHTWQITAAMLTWHSVYIQWKGKKDPVAVPAETG